LIEVIGALMIFSVGVLMVIQVSGALGTQMRYAGLRSELVVMAGERIDSLEALPFALLSTGTTVDTVTASGTAYARTVAVSAVTPVLARLDVSMAAIDGAGPAYSVTSYTSRPR
jgi:Tfp pilus assembly protein PilV